ncbi:hypothetical protein CMV30_01480 [Nibricoccus aquaticus]|uniref:histidine kinase n=1 Tax=Nibricoccus aquaticus TaxID=2576891 RepID=A0A290QFT8_9BACT|nr:response regulator [Nibricoccus aquaticus]ATC62742.1 hypothetical protein CMV30_01480 [Nibricoccus aquaticus]
MNPQETHLKAKIRVLLLEDRAVDAEIMMRELKRAGFEPEWERVQDKEGFCARLDASLDLILADFNLPAFDGLRALDEVRLRDLDVPCIVVSGSIGDEKAVECIKRGAVDYLLKDRLARLGQAVTQALKDRRQKRESKAAAEALQRSEERFSKAFHSSPAALMISRKSDGVILEVNRAFSELFRCPREEAVGKTSLALNLVDPVVLSRYRALIGATDSVLNYEMDMHTRTGEPLSVLLSSEVVEDGTESCILTTGVNITERKQAEIRMELEYAVTRALADGAALRVTAVKILEIICRMLRWDAGMLWKVDTAGKVLQCVELWHAPSARGAMERFAEESRKRVFVQGQGLPGRVWATRAPAWISRLSQDTAFLRREIAEEAGMQSGMGFPVLWQGEVLAVVEFYNARCVQPDGKMLTLLATLGTQLGQYIERQQLEEQYRHSQKMEAIGTLAGGVAHDFNNILTAIYGYSEIAKMDAGENDAVRNSLDAIVKAARRATSLVRQILTFSRQQPQQRSVVQMGTIVGEVLTLLRATLPATIEIKYLSARECSSVLADATQIHQVLMNLGTNAWHAMRDQAGRLEIRLEDFDVDREFVQARPALRPGRYVRLSVSDTGSGMDQATQARIFEPFFTTKGPGEGTGLGLAVVHGIMQGHDGAITVYSQRGEGTTFHLYFPAHGAMPVLGEVEGAPVPRGNGQRILYVDDEQALAEMGQKMLERLGYAVDICCVPREALRLFAENPGGFDLVVTDQTMPGMTGIELVRELLHIRPGLPVILTTGYVGTLTVERIRELGIRELMMKPHSVRTTAETVRRSLEG